MPIAFALTATSGSGNLIAYAGTRQSHSCFLLLLYLTENGTGLLLDSHHRICRSSLQRLESRQEFTLELEQAGV